ncbi:MAG TPA: N,N-dimethylformamidase beta subunit family domain-containing protein [Gaiellaceae bacterium]
MATSSALSKVALLAAAAIVLSTAGSRDTRPEWLKNLDADELELVGYSGSVPDSTKPKVTAFFANESYAPGSTAQLQIDDKASELTLQIFRAGTSFRRIAANDVMTGLAVGPSRMIGPAHGNRTVPVHLGSWPSGLYYAQLTAAGDRIGYATFVLRPKRLGEHRVAIVLPTQTWQAYNFRDDNRDGVPDTWYAAGSTAPLSRPFLNRGVPPHYKNYDARFLGWAYLTHHKADIISDAELNSASGAALRKAYRLLIFEGHHEYVTQHEYTAVKQFRDLGGNLIFLSANNFFWKITIADGMMTRVAKWRDLGQPEAALIGVQYYHNDMGEHRGPWIVKPAVKKLPWLIGGTGLAIGMPFSSGGIEADDVTSASPKSVRVIAAIPNLYGDGRNAEMTYYETSQGAKVFAAGAFTIAGSVWQGHVRQMMENLWQWMSRESAPRA